MEFKPELHIDMLSLSVVHVLMLVIDVAFQKQ